MVDKDHFIDITMLAARRQVVSGKALYSVAKSGAVTISIPIDKLKEAGFFPGESRVQVLYNPSSKKLLFQSRNNGFLLRKQSNSRCVIGFKWREAMHLPVERIETTEIYIDAANRGTLVILLSGGQNEDNL